MNRKLTSVLSACLALGTLFNEPTRRVKPIKSGPEYRSPSRVWTCKKCGDKFYPHYSNSMCDDCIKRRDA